ncbi:NB-ARC domain-containing protein [Streptomyces sp. AHU1]|uniref:NB-ARC domain-containing protein n=1 Tax=Streptomyces sp. AHU1 TaxID=3377215 RepID=UPI003877B916
MSNGEANCRGQGSPNWGGVVAVDGGRVAAYGFQYQYLRTLEHLVGLLGQAESAGVRVEGSPLSETATDKVDFDVVDHNGDVLLVTQVKSRVAGGSLGGTAALGILLDMIRGEPNHPAYSLLTNGRPDEKSSRLQQILISASDTRELRAQLDDLCREAPQRRSQIAALSEEELARLRRCRVDYDSRDDEDIREELRNALRNIRNSTRLGLGEESAGLLVGYLISEVFGRAADLSGERANFSVAELRRLALVDGETLARTVGSLDWGVVVGPLPRIPDVPRPQVVNSIMDAFPRTPNRATRFVNLVGPSGIGKSSSAALYISACADQYDVIAWINCETANSLYSDFRQALQALDPSKQGGKFASPEELRRDIQLTLGRFPGRWLLILDNALSVREVEPWVPKVSRGDVIMTTINSAAPAGNAHVVTVSILERGQSVELLRRRLQLAEGESTQWRPALKRMAEELGDWPLALELGAGYLVGCGYGIESSDVYIDALRTRAISDHYSIPAGYPRTLAAALNMCIDKLEKRIEDATGSTPDPAAVATHILIMSAFLGSHQIPAHLLLATALSNPEEEEKHSGPLIVSPAIIRLGEVLRELFHFSLAKNDLPLPTSRDGEFPEATRTITVNSVAQQIIRMRVVSHRDLPSFIDRLVGHVERWLRASSEFGMTERVQAIQSHAEMLLTHAEEAGVRSERVALLCGNLAGPYQLLGDPCRAERLLKLELQILQEVAPDNETLISQTRFMLAHMYLYSNCNSERPTIPELETTYDETVKHLEYVLYVSRGWVDTYPKAAMKFAADIRTILHDRHTNLDGLTELNYLADAFSDLESRLPESNYSQNLGLIVSSEERIREGYFDVAESNCREVLQSDPVGWTNAEARRLLIEALARQGKWAEARKEVEFWKADPAAPSLFRESILDLIRNVGHACAEALIAGDSRALSVMYELVSWPNLDSFMHLGSAEDQRAIDLLRQVCIEISSQR